MISQSRKHGNGVLFMRKTTGKKEIMFDYNVKRLKIKRKMHSLKCQ
jgi:hypothetical protein